MIVGGYYGLETVKNCVTNYITILDMIIYLLFPLGKKSHKKGMWKL
jgi:hypothetical protein